ncbi:MAG TPA: type II/IV secretion system protein [Marinilabiliales bacterium]|nr:type II/IV secretion system protein [Marinilabiliales bacterium]
MSNTPEPQKITTRLLQIITSRQAWNYFILPQQINEQQVTFLISDKQKTDEVREELELLYGKKVVLIPTPHEVLEKQLSFYYRKEQQGKQTTKRLSLESASDFLVQMIHEADSMGCSDIHIEVFEKQGKVRYRIDGKLSERYVISLGEYPSLVNKVKIRANLDIAEKRLPQDGRIFFEEGGKKFDIRVSSLPTLYGEKVVMRLLSKDSTNIDIATLGMSERQLQDFLQSVKKPHGIVLISGPTGSGKTTTLYATLKILNNHQTNILTIEDPIEYTLEGINQVQLKESIGLTFASALRTFLRQDPDIIMLGEIRDGETAQMAIRAALTGHLVLSTIHTNSAWGSISRLLDMGVPPYLIAGTLTLTVAQRLIRKLCPHCKTQGPIAQGVFPIGYKIPFPIEKQHIPVGCPQCYYTGYNGRTALYEVIPINQEYAGFIKNRKNDIHENLLNDGIVPLSVRAYNLLAEGVTSLEEVYPILLNSL